MADLKLSYGNDTLDTIDGERDQVRSKPSIYFGTDDVIGALNGVLEIVTNGADEVGAGFGDTIITEVDEDYNIKVTDNGRGVPMAWNEAKQQWNWHIVYNRLYGSGKYGSSVYANAAGLNGVGAAITQFTSLYMKVISRRMEEVTLPNGKTGIEYNEYEMNFENGSPKGELIARKWNPNEQTTGTTVQWKTDPTVFQDVKFTVEQLLFKLRRLATIAGGTHYIVRYKELPEMDVYFEKGPETFLGMETEGRLTKDIIHFSGEKEVAEIIKGKTEKFPVRAKVWMTFSVDKNFVETYHNNAYMIENGTSYDGVKNALARVVEAYAKKNSKIGSKDKISANDIDDVLCCIVASEFRGDFSSFAGQDKRAIKNDFLLGAFSQVTADNFTEWVSTHDDEMKKVIEVILANKMAKEKAAAVKRNIIKKMSSGVNSFKTRPAKLVDCEYGPEKDNEIYFVEGESAKGTAVLARSPKFQAVYPLTGKILNCDKASVEAMFNNKVILDLIQIAGCGVEVKSKYVKDLPQFDITKLNYSKLIINTDADLDGWHIQCLLIVFFYKVMPSVIKHGRLYIAEAPLFRIEGTVGGKKSGVYAYTEEEKDKIVAELKKNGVTKLNILRFKGLGEMDSTQLADSTMNPATRRLTRVDWPADVEAFEKTMHELMGDDLMARKSWIEDYFEYTKDKEGETGEVEVSIGYRDSEDDYVATVIED